MNKVILFICLLFFAHVDADLDVNDRVCSPSECYTVIEKLGEGAFGEVYAVENSVGKQFAMKAYLSFPDDYDDYADYNDLDDFWVSLGSPKREYQIGQKLDHPNIIKSIEVFTGIETEEKIQHYVILELVDGTILHDIPKKNYTSDEIRISIFQFIGALHYALSNQHIHLDLHPGNLMMTPTADLKIIDLASFFTFDEISNFINDLIEGSYAATTSLDDEASELHIKGGSFLVPDKEKKLYAFFKQHPEVLTKMMDAYRNGSNGMVQKELRTKQIEHFLYPILAFYFDGITETCMQIISKSTLSREEKIALQIEIKKIAWNYLEDIEEEIYANPMIYFDQLNEVVNIESKNSP